MDEKLINFRLPTETAKSIIEIATELYGYGGVKRLYNELSTNFIQKYDSKIKKLDSFLDPNFIPKPTTFDDLEKIMVPYIQKLNEDELYNLKVWAFQVHVFANAYAKLGPQRRQSIKLTYTQACDMDRDVLL